MADATAKIVGVDTTVLIWGHRRQGSPEELDSARWLLESFDSDKAIIIVSTPVLSEYLTPADPSHHAGIVAELSKRFTITAFDVKAASIAAMLFKRNLDTAIRTYANWRQVLRADCAVVAAARSAGVQDFYSHDPQCRRFAQTVGMRPHPLPTIPNSLYDPTFQQPATTPQTLPPPPPPEP